MVRSTPCFQPLRNCQHNNTMEPSSTSPNSHSYYENLNHAKLFANKDNQQRLIVCNYRSSVIHLPAVTAYWQMDVGTGRKFLVFNQSGDKTDLIISSGSTPTSNMVNKKSLSFYGSTNNNPIVISNKNITSDCGGGDELHEDTEEIDALLYSCSEDEEEISTGHSPIKTSSAQKVASFTVPSKRKTLSEDVDTALIDTASSETKFHLWQNGANNFKWSTVKHTCVGQSVGEQIEKSLATNHNKRLKRIHETIYVLRRIIPGSKGKDTLSLLDKAIRHLRCLKAQTKN